MPIYVYEVIKANGKPGEQFEIMQGIHDKPLKKHPETGKPIKRVIASLSAPKFRYDRAVKQIQKSDKTYKAPHEMP